LRQRITLWSRTRPLTTAETYAYVQERLRLAGATEPLFHPEAIEAIYRYSKGIPRLINLLGEHSMMGAYVEQLKPVPAHIVESVAKDFELDTAPIVLMNEVSNELGSVHQPNNAAVGPEFAVAKIKGHIA
jgi:general secretion pathway protein A